MSKTAQARQRQRLRRKDKRRQMRREDNANKGPAWNMELLAKYLEAGGKL